MSVWIQEEHSGQHASWVQGERKMKHPGRSHKHLSPMPQTHRHTQRSQQAPHTFPAQRAWLRSDNICLGANNPSSQELGDTQSTSDTIPSRLPSLPPLAGGGGSLRVPMATLRSDFGVVTSLWGHWAQAGLSLPPEEMDKL